MQVIPVQSVAAQAFSVLLADQNCQIDIAQKSTGMFISLYVDGSLVIGSVVCENLNRIVRSLYLGFVGDLMFDDLQGSSDPNYLELGSRFILLYIPADELPSGQG